MRDIKLWWKRVSQCVLTLLCLPELLDAALLRADEPALALATTSQLADAVEARDRVAIEQMLHSGVDVNVSQADGTTALHWAVLADDNLLVDRLLAGGAHPSAKNVYGVPPLALACTNGLAASVQSLLAGGADPHATLAGGESLLMIAARTGRLAPVELLVKQGVDINGRDRRRQTAVMWAAAEGHTLVVESLIEAGADFTTPLDSGFTPLFFAVREGRTATSLALLKHGLDIDASISGKKRQRGPNPLLLAVENGHFETAVALLAAGADPGLQPAGHAPLHAIVDVRKPLRGDGDPAPVGSGKVGALELVRALVAHGADVNQRLERGRSGFAEFTTTGATPFLLASRTADLPLLELLLELGADPALANADGSTPLLAAAGVGDLGSGLESAATSEEALQVVQRLLELGADIHVVDGNGETVMHGAAYQNWPQVIGLLAERGADVEIWNRKNKWGWTPLMIARGYRSGNFRPDGATTAAVEEVMLAAGLTPPTTSEVGER